MRHSVQIPETDDESSEDAAPDEPCEGDEAVPLDVLDSVEALVGLDELGVAAGPEDGVELPLVLPFPFPFWDEPELLPELVEVLSASPAASLGEANPLLSLAWAAASVPSSAPVVLLLPFPLPRGAIWLTAITPRASAPTAAAACTPELMARRRDGS